MYSNCNVHLPLVFDDGVKWLVRARRYRVSEAPKELQRIVSESEVETCKTLHEHGVKVPMAWLADSANSMCCSWLV